MVSATIFSSVSADLFAIKYDATVVFKFLAVTEGVCDRLSIRRRNFNQNFTIKFSPDSIGNEDSDCSFTNVDGPLIIKFERRYSFEGGSVGGRKLVEITRYH